jgi:hypothetical protein
MRRQGEIDAGTTAQRWLAAMTPAFPDVREGDRLTGLHRPGDGLHASSQRPLRGEWRDADVRAPVLRHLAGPQTSEPALREALLGP